MTREEITWEGIKMNIITRLLALFCLILLGTLVTKNKTIAIDFITFYDIQEQNTDCGGY